MASMTGEGRVGQRHTRHRCLTRVTVENDVCCIGHGGISNGQICSFSLFLTLMETRTKVFFLVFWFPPPVMTIQKNG